MAYRNNPFRPRKFTYPNNTLPRPNPPPMEADYPEFLKAAEEIPLPNVAQVPPVKQPDRKQGFRIPLPGLFKNGITVEEIILLGLIFLILDEGIQDEFLLLMLIYILLI